MIRFAIQLLDWLTTARVHYFLLFFLCAWLTWLIKVLLSTLYRPSGAAHTAIASVVIPTVDEPPELFREVLRRISDQHPHEVIVVINGPRNDALERVCAEFSIVRQIWIPEAGKRNAIRMGVEAATGEIVVLSDSDTVWEVNALSELLKPFADSKVGGVAAHAKIWRPKRSLWTRFASWMEDFRTSYSLPASSIWGQVGCLPGRTIAIRRQLVVDSLPQFMNETFLGIHLEISDDRSLTNFVLLKGFKTVYQRSSIVYTDAPVLPFKFIRQQYRWAKGSQYNSLKMLPWMLRNAWFLAFGYTTDIALSFFLIGVYVNFAWPVVHANNGQTSGIVLTQYLLLSLVGGTLGMALKQPRRLIEDPIEILLLPFYWLIVVFILTPVRLWGFVRMGYDEAWGTRQNAYAGSAKRSLLRWVPPMIALSIFAFFVILGPIVESWSHKN